jgi:hypothetical protein
MRKRGVLASVNLESSVKATASLKVAYAVADP